jgi:hypothetical protein
METPLSLSDSPKEYSMESSLPLSDSEPPWSLLVSRIVCWISFPPKLKAETALEILVSRLQSAESETMAWLNISHYPVVECGIDCPPSSGKRCIVKSLLEEESSLSLGQYNFHPRMVVSLNGEDEGREHGGMQPCTETRGDNAMRKSSLAATRDGAGITQGLRHPKRKRASIVDKTAHQSQSKRQRLSPPDSENESSSSEDDDEDDADYELNETRNNGYVSSPSPAYDSEERPVQSVRSDDIVNPEMLIPVYIPQKYLRYLAFQQSMQSATASVKSRNLKRKPASVKATGTRYTEDDDRQLLELKEERGMSWQEIQREYFPKREINSLQVHYCTKVNPKRKKDHVLHA